MGCTSWRYYVPYQADPGTALQELRLSVFARGEYVDPSGSIEDRVRQFALKTGEDPGSKEFRRSVQSAKNWQRAMETGEMQGLSASERAAVGRIRAALELAAVLGATPPRPRNGPAKTIEELLERAAECGTHSILDIEFVDSQPGLAVAAPIQPSVMRQVFRTTRPTHPVVEDYWADMAERLAPWHACFLTVYADGQPAEYCFIGCSGD